MRRMLDAAALPRDLPVVDAIAGYLPSPHASNPWPASEWARAATLATWLLPIYVVGPSFDGGGALDEILSACDHLNIPGGSTIGIDVEHHDAAGAFSSGIVPFLQSQLAHNGFGEITYCSRTDAHLFPGHLWVGDWTNVPHQVAGAEIVQYASPASDARLHVDLSVIYDDELPLWSPHDPHPGGAPVANRLMAVNPAGPGYWILHTDTGAVYAYGCHYHGGANALKVKPKGPFTAICATHTGNGYYILGNDGGVFAFGDALFYGSNVMDADPAAIAAHPTAVRGVSA